MIISLPMMLAVIPPLFLLWEVYRHDKVEKEPIGLIFKLFVFGCIAVIPTAITEEILIAGLSSVVAKNTIAFLVIENFICVAIVEEFFKYVMMKKASWKNPAFDYKFDAIVYAVAASIGFATLENIMYVNQWGLEVAIIRAFTAIPGHTIFGIFMGVYYGLAKLYELNGHPVRSKSLRVKAVLVPAVIHGFYDFIASMGGAYVLIFYVFIIVIDIIAIRRIRREARNDYML